MDMLFFLAPSDLLTSPQSDLLKGWLKEEASLVAMISLPENLFANAKQSKTILSYRRKMKYQWSLLFIHLLVYKMQSCF